MRGRNRVSAGLGRGEPPSLADKMGHRVQDRPGPLNGIRVFDWTVWGVGPFAGLMLGALGADVIKVEGPDGDPQLKSENMQRGMSAMYINQNLCKRSIELDLSKAHGRANALQLLETCDVFINNMRAGTPDRLGVGYDRVAAVSPGIIYCVATGWGSQGPMRDMGGVDVLAQAFSGMASITGSTNGPPELYRQLGNLDYTTSNAVVAGIVEALYARERSGAGRRLDVSLLEASIAVQGTRLAEYLATGSLVPRLGSANSSRAPDQAFQSSDRRHFAVSIESDAQWLRLCHAVDRPDLGEDPRLLSNSGRVEYVDEVADALQRTFDTAPLEWWDLQLTSHRIPHALFCDFTAMKWHAQVRDNRLLVRVPTRWGQIYSGAAPWSLSDEPPMLWTSPVPGGDTKQVLASMANDKKSWRPTDASRQSATGDSMPLNGVRVLDLTCGISGPYCGQLLSAGGAEVVKLERPVGDHSREWLPKTESGESAVYLFLNHNKTICRASSDAEYVRLARRWVATADVVLVDSVDSDGSKPAVGYPLAKKENPRLVYCSISGLGEHGPMAKVPASELPVQAIATVAGGLGTVDEAPIRIGADLAAMSAAVNAFQVVVAALYSRQRTGLGQRVSVSLLGSLLFLKSFHWGSFTAPDTWGTSIVHRSWTQRPRHGYRTSDGRVYFSWYRGDQAAFQLLLDELGIGHLGRTDPRFQAGAGATSGLGKYGDECVSIYEDAFANRTTAEVLEILVRHAAYAVPFLDYAELVGHAQVEALRMLEVFEVDSEVMRVPRRPWRFEGLAATPLPPTVMFGADADKTADPWVTRR